jgi:eukaryotic-like serine/threonine-protein kinase
LSTITVAGLIIIIFIWLSLFFEINQHQIAIIVAQTDEPNFVPYSNPIFGVRTEYPANWGRLDLSFLQNDSADIDFYPLDDTSGSKHVRIQVETIQSAQNMTLEQYSETKINSTEGQILKSNSTTLTGLPAHEIVFTNAGLQKIQVWTIKDDRIFTITYEADEEDFQNDLLVAERMIESFQIE